MDIQPETVPTPTATSSLTISNCILSVVMSGIFLFGGVSNVFSLHFFLKQRPVNATGVTFRMITLVDLMTCIQASSTKICFLNPQSPELLPLREAQISSLPSTDYLPICIFRLRQQSPNCFAQHLFLRYCRC